MTVSPDSPVMAPTPDDKRPLPTNGEVAVSLAGLVEDAEAIYVAPNWKLVWWRFKRHRLALISGVVLIAVTIVALFPEFFSTQDPNQTSATKSFIPVQAVHFFDEGRLRPYVYGVQGQRNPASLRMEWQIDEATRIPVRFFAKGYEYELLGFIPTNIHFLGVASPEAEEAIHLLGTDRLGRDQWSRLMHGSQVSLSIGLVAVFMSIFFGILLGGISGYFGGLADLVIQRLIEILQSLPPIPIWMALTAAMPRDWSVQQVYFAITVILSLIGWTTLGREVRGRFLALREEDFVVAAQLAGCSQMRVIFRHMVPTFTSHIIATSTLAIPVMIINETFLSFLGLGLRPPAISWGVLLQEAQNLQSIVLAPWLLLPGLAVIITVLALNILGDGLRDAADPYA
ncbi:MAG: ABC transporter permease [Anaerolineales bacterium]|nr:MAG: ABC transporter permease [Anaerolineales bacterium]